MRLPAEWEYRSAILVSLPHADTDWNYMLDDILSCYKNMVDALSGYHPVIVVSPDTELAKEHIWTNASVHFFRADTNDTWIRDYGPITLVADNGEYSVMDFRFNGWGLKFASCFDNMVTNHMAESSLITVPVRCCQDFVLEGGGIESDGRGSLMTTASCQLSPNRNPVKSREEITEYLKTSFGANQVLWLNHGWLSGDDTDGHIDTLARFFHNDTIVYTGCGDPYDEHYEELCLMKREIEMFRKPDGSAFNLVELPLPDPVFDESGMRLPATYCNFLITDKAMFLPVYNQQYKDHLAIEICRSISPVPVVPVDCSALIQQHGSLHCATMQVPRNILSI